MELKVRVKRLGERRPADIVRRDSFRRFLPIEPAVATLLAPSSFCWSTRRIRALIAFAWLAARRRSATASLSSGRWRARFFHAASSCIARPSPTSPIASLGLRPWAGSWLGRRLTSWISDGLASFSRGSSVFRRDPMRPISRQRRGTIPLVRATSSASSSTTHSSTAFRAMGAAQGTPLRRSADAVVNFEFTCWISADFRRQSCAVHRRHWRRRSIRVGRNAASFNFFDENALML